MDGARAIFLVAAPDQPGLVARLAGFFYDLRLNILDASNHSDLHAESGSPRFFMRLDVDLEKLACTRRVLEESFGELAHALQATWSVRYTDVVQRMAILVTREAACLYDLILRQREGELPCEIALVAGNRPALESVAEGFRIPFFALPVTPETKREQEGQLLELLRRHHVDLVVLARYMQILSAEFLAQAPPAINIHHGFLPAFQGARPYHQAHQRGVKMIGATAHYVTAELDEGPIIEQDIERVTHRDEPETLARIGRDVERVVLARAVKWHLDDRILVDGNRTVVF